MHQPHMTGHTPHRTILDLHRLVDPALAPLFEPVGLTASTQSILGVDREDIVELVEAGEAQTALVTLDGANTAPAIVIAEPALSDALLARIWQTGRNEGDELTSVERGILQQLLNDICGQWRSAWRSNGISLLPSLAMVASLSMLTDKLATGGWSIARTVVASGDTPLGVLLFCYPESLNGILTETRESIRWRSRIQRGLDQAERAQLQVRLGELRDIRIPVPVTAGTTLPLKAMNALERGDVIAFGSPSEPLDLRLLDQPISGNLAQVGTHLAIRVEQGALAPDSTAAANMDSLPQNPVDGDGLLTTDQTAAGE